jgi:hypothetical protein
MLLWPAAVYSESVQVRFCPNTKNTDPKVSVQLVVRNVDTGKETTIGVLNYSQPRTISATLNSGTYQFSGYLNGGKQFRASSPMQVGSGDSFGIGAIVFGSAQAEITIDRGSCGN